MKQRISERDLVPQMLEILAGSENGTLKTGEIREHLKEVHQPSGADARELPSRSDTSFDQKVRNLKSHRKSKGNPISEGLIEDVPGGFRITDIGREHIAKSGADRPEQLNFKL